MGALPYIAAIAVLWAGGLWFIREARREAQRREARERAEVFRRFSESIAEAMRSLRPAFERFNKEVQATARAYRAFARAYSAELEKRKGTRS